MIFREMKRKKQLLSKGETEAILSRGKTGVLGICSSNDYPYTVPLNYAYRNSKIYFHCAEEGQKIDGIKDNNRVSFTVIDKDEIAEELFTTLYRSVIAFGKARIVTDETEKRNALQWLIEKYTPNHIREGQEEIENKLHRTGIVEIEIEHMTGKAGKDELNNFGK